MRLIFRNLFLTILFCFSPNFIQAQDEIRYIAVGDSYTIGTGAPDGAAWPTVLTQELKSRGINIILISNLAVAGKTSAQIIHQQLPVFENSRPTFATLLVGANDCFNDFDTEVFKQNLKTILDRMLGALPQKDKLVVVTIPDFSSSPYGASSPRRGEWLKKLKIFNAIIKKEVKDRHLACVDLFPISQKMATDPQFMSPDGLHPSAKGYYLWEKLIFPEVFKILNKT